MGTVTINFVTRDGDLGTWRLILVEQGPWAVEDTDQNLRRLQERLYGCVDAALDGKIAELYPESTGRRIVVRLDAYDVPEREVREFFDRFASKVLHVPDYRASLAGSRFVKSIGFELNVEQLPREHG